MSKSGFRVTEPSDSFVLVFTGPQPITKKLDARTRLVDQSRAQSEQQSDIKCIEG